MDGDTTQEGFGLQSKQLTVDLHTRREEALARSAEVEANTWLDLELTVWGASEGLPEEWLPKFYRSVLSSRDSSTDPVKKVVFDQALGLVVKNARRLRVTIPGVVGPYRNTQPAS